MIFFGSPPALQGAEEFAAAGDVEAAALLGEQLADVDVAAAFDGVADGRVDRRERLGDLPIVVQQRRLGIDIGRRADLAGDFLGRDVFAIKLAVFVVEEIHGSRLFRRGILVARRTECEIRLRSRAA